MALDVQPLSMGRRVARVVVMLALLAGSLGVAQWLVVLSHAKHAEGIRIPKAIEQRP